MHIKELYADSVGSLTVVNELTESELQPAWFCSLLLMKACLYNILFEFEARQPQTIIVQQAYLDKRNSSLKKF